MNHITPNIARLAVVKAYGEHLYPFVQASFPVVSGGQKLLPNWHIEAMADALCQVIEGKIHRLIITVPPRSLKSICASVCLPAFALGRDPTRKIICVSYSEALARKHAGDFRALMRSEFYREVFPGAKISPNKDTELEVMTTERGVRLATSVGGALTGRGGDLVTIDDPLKPQDAHSESARQSLLQWYSHTLLSRLDHKSEGAIIIVMQRLHPEDLVGHVLEQGGWHHINLPAIAEEESRIALGPNRIHYRKVGELLHPARENRKALDELKAAMGSMEFTAQYQQAPVPLGGNLIKWSWFKFYQIPPIPQSGDKLIVSWDTALTSNELGDYSACVVLLARGETIYVLDVFRQRLEYPELKRAVIARHEGWRNVASSYALCIEKKGSGLSIIQDLQRDQIYAIGVEPEGDKIMRMVAQTPQIEAGAVHLPKEAPWLDDFKKEILSFPKSKNDDQVDAFSQALARAIQPDSPKAQFGFYGM